MDQATGNMAEAWFMLPSEQICCLWSVEKTLQSAGDSEK